MEYRGRSDLPASARLYLQSRYNAKTGCIEIQKHEAGDGYVQIRINGKLIMAHHYAWKLEGKRLYPNRELDHTCQNPKCINVNHLEAVTHAENVRRSFARGRKHVPTKLTQEKANKIRSLYSTGLYTGSRLATMFKVKTSTVRDVLSGRRWNHGQDT